MDIQTDRVTWSDGLFRIFRRDPSEGAPSFAEHPKFYVPEDMQRLKEAVETCISNGKPYEIELRAIRSDGQIRDCVSRGQGEKDESGKVNRMVGFLQDITERKQVEQEILRQRSFLEKAQEIGSIGTWELDTIRNVLLWTDENYRIFGLPVGTDLTYEKFLECVHPDDREYVDTEWRTAMKGKPYDIEHRLLVDGEVRWVRAKAELIFDEEGNFLSATGVTQDITDRKQAEEELRRNEKDLKGSQRIAKLGSWRLDVQTNEVYWTEELYRMYGFDPNLPPPPYTEHMKLFTPKSWQLLSTSLAKTVETGVPYELELEMVKPDGSNGWMWVRGEAICDESGKTVELWGAAQDITDRKLTEELLKKSQEDYRFLTENIPDIIWTTDLNLQTTYVSPSVEKVLGFSLEERKRQRIEEMITPESFQRCIELLTREMQNDQEGADPRQIGEDRSRVLS